MLERSLVFFFSSRRRHTRSLRDWSSDVCSSDLEGPAMQDLLRTAVRRPDCAEHATILLRASEVAPTTSPSGDEALSERELDVLRPLATDLTGPEIARRLFVSVNTLRTHTKHIFTKLDVN